MKLVKFEDGKFGVRKFWLFGWWFADLVDNNHNWHRWSYYFKECKRSRERAELYIKNHNNKIDGKYEVINETN